MRYSWIRSFMAAIYVLLSITISHAQKVAPIDIVVIDEYTDVPAHCNYISSISVSTDYPGYNLVATTFIEARYQAYKRGGNVLKITKRKPPQPFFSRYIIYADVYYTDSLNALKLPVTKTLDTITTKLISDTAQYALVYVYRFRSSIGT